MPFYALLFRVDPEENANRWYEVYSGRSLIDETAVICRWGRRGTAGQRALILPTAGPAAADELARKIADRKQARGYMVHRVHFDVES